MKKTDSPALAHKPRLAKLSKAELVARIESLPCGQVHVDEFCPVERMRHELGVQQIELEVQNQELRESRQQIENARDRYSHLYDFAPVGYVTLDLQGAIRQINLTGAAMLGSERNKLVGKPLALWLHENCLAAFAQHLNRVFQSSERIVDEMTLRGDDGALRHISMLSMAISQGPQAAPTCRTALVDISSLKAKEEELTHSRQQLRNLAAHLDRIRENERRHLAREVHDELGQKLTAMRFEVAMLGTSREPSQLAQVAAALTQQIDETIEAVRSIASDLRPAVLDLGLAAAIEWQVKDFCRRTGMAYGLKLKGEEIDLDNERATAVFRIVQESLTNTLRHAQASKVEVSMRKVGDRLLLQVADNGVGLSAAALEKSRTFGIAGMRERVLLLDGAIEISGHPGHGTTLKVSIPLHGGDDADPHTDR